MRNRASKCEWHHAPEARGGFWAILKKSVSWDETGLGRRRLVFACSRRPLSGGGGADEKASIKRLSLSPYVEEPLNSKVIKISFVPELRSRYVFFEFRDSYLYGHSMYVSHIAISWLWYTNWTAILTYIDLQNPKLNYDSTAVDL